MNKQPDFVDQIIAVLRDEDCHIWDVVSIIHRLKGRGRWVDSHDELYRPVLRVLHKLEGQGIVSSERFFATNQTVWWLKDRVK